MTVGAHSILAFLAAASLAAPTKPVVPIDQATWQALAAKALKQPPRDTGANTYVYTIENTAAVTSSPCPAGTSPENRLEVIRFKPGVTGNLQADVNLQVLCVDSRGFLAAGVFVWARSDDRTITHEDMYTGDPDQAKATKIIIADGQPQPGVVDLPVLQAALTQALKSLAAP